MKKLFALLISLGALSSVFAQDHARDINHNYPNSTVYNNSKTYSSREKAAQIERINYDFARQIDFVQRDTRLSRREKKRQVSMLERQRDQQIHEVIARSSNGRYDDGRYAQNNRRY